MGTSPAYVGTSDNTGMGRRCFEYEYFNGFIMVKETSMDGCVAAKGYFVVYLQRCSSLGIDATCESVLRFQNELESNLYKSTQSPSCAYSMHAQFILGVILHRNPKTQKAKTGMALLQSAAQAGHSCAQNYLGELCSRGDGIVVDLPQAVEWFRKAAEQGYAVAQHNLGDRYYEGIGATKDAKEAAKWFEEAARQGYAPAQYMVALSLFGTKTGQCAVTAVSWLHRAAQQGHPPSCAMLGDCFVEGKGIAKDYGKAIEWLLKGTASGKSTPKTRYYLGHLYFYGNGVEKDVSKGLELIREAAQEGCDKAQLRLGRIYKNGVEVTEDEKEAVNWFDKSASQGNSNACYELGSIWLCRCISDTTVTTEYSMAVKYMQIAAEKGNEWAQVNLGHLLVWNLRGHTPDYTRACEWLQKSASQDNFHALWWLALYQCFGYGIPSGTNRFIAALGNLRKYCKIRFGITRWFVLTVTIAIVLRFFIGRISGIRQGRAASQVGMQVLKSALSNATEAMAAANIAAPNEQLNVTDVIADANMSLPKMTDAIAIERLAVLQALRNLMDAIAAAHADKDLPL